jgi:hypothetical protein
VVTIRKQANRLEIKAIEKFYRPDEGLGIFERHTGDDIPRIKLFV